MKNMRKPHFVTSTITPFTSSHQSNINPSCRQPPEREHPSQLSGKTQAVRARFTHAMKPFTECFPTHAKRARKCAGHSACSPSDTAIATAGAAMGAATAGTATLKIFKKPETFVRGGPHGHMFSERLGRAVEPQRCRTAVCLGGRSHGGQALSRLLNIMSISWSRSSWAFVSQDY